MALNEKVTFALLFLAWNKISIVSRMAGGGTRRFENSCEKDGDAKMKNVGTFKLFIFSFRTRAPLVYLSREDLFASIPRDEIPKWKLSVWKSPLGN